MIGRTLSHYQVLEEIGRGGMGIVYRAADLQLERDVAIKVLREELATESTRLKRFEQEARSASALNHPNIVTIHDIGEHDSTPYIAMEYVKGKTLREVLSEEVLSTKKLLHLAVQIAEGLAKAHTAGIIHRDLKPENLMVTGDGFVKIMDFGLAKLVPTLSESGSDAVTMTKEGTLPGAVVGTVGYMSPEQAKGREVDFRSDQFAFGSILYEMVTGKRAFHRDSTVQTLSSVIEDEPASIARLNPKAPAHLRIIVERCLAKKPEERYDSTGDLAKDLKSLQEIPVDPVASHSRRSLLPSAIGLLLVVLAIAAAFNVSGLRDWLTGAGSQRPIESIAVLPLDNLSGDPEQEFFSDGMTEAIITDLAKIGSLKVISRTSAMRYKDTDKSIPEIASELNVDGIVEGSILRAGGRVRITAQLIEAVTDQHLWAETYERELQDILSLQSEVARAISREIRVQLTPEEERRLTTAQTVIPEAHEAYLMGRHHWNKFTADGFQSAVKSFEKAIEIDPSYAPAYAGLADSHMTAAWWGFVRPRDVVPQGKAAAGRAVELDDTLSEGHNSLAAFRFWFDWDWDAGTDFEKAIELNPGNALARYWYGVYLGIMRQTDERIEQVERARELDPLMPIIHFGYAWGLRILGHYDESIAHCRKILEFQPEFLPSYIGLASCYRAKDQQEEWLESTKKLWNLLGHSDVAEALEKGYLKSGASGASLAAAAKAAELSGTRYVPPYYIALLYHDAEEWDKCVDWLEKSSEERGGMLLSLFWDEPIQSHPRFQALLRRMNLPQ